MSQKSFDISKDAFITKLRTERTTREDIFFAYQNALKLGMKEDIRKIMYSSAETLTLYDLKRYQEQNLKNKPQTILVLGNEKDLNMKVLKKYGKVKKLKIEQIFGY
jgi:hypothetical protein